MRRTPRGPQRDADTRNRPVLGARAIVRAPAAAGVAGVVAEHAPDNGVPLVAVEVHARVVPARLDDHRAAAQQAIVRQCRVPDVEGAPAPEVLQRALHEELRLPVGEVALEIALLLAADKRGEIAVPRSWLRPVPRQVRVVPHIIRAGEEREVVVLEPGRAHVERGLPHPVAGVLREPHVRAATRHRGGGRVKFVGKESAGARPAVGALEIARAGKLPRENLPAVACDGRQRVLPAQRVDLIMPGVQEIAAEKLGVAIQSWCECAVHLPYD